MYVASNITSSNVSGLSFSKRRGFFESDSLHNAQLPDEIRVVITSQLQTLSGAAKGLTRAQDLLLILDDPKMESSVSAYSTQVIITGW